MQSNLTVYAIKFNCVKQENTQLIQVMSHKSMNNSYGFKSNCTERNLHVQYGFKRKIYERPEKFIL